MHFSIYSALFYKNSEHAAFLLVHSGDLSPLEDLKTKQQN